MTTRIIPLTTVAPFVGAWIEIVVACILLNVASSRSVRRSVD